MKSFSIRRLTKREKILVGCLGAILFAVIYILYIINPMLAKYSDSKKRAEAIMQQVELLKEAQRNLPAMEKSIKHDHFKIAFLSAKFFPEIVQEKFIVMIDELAANTGASISTIGFSKPVLSKIDLPKMASDAGNEDDIMGALATQYRGTAPYKEDTNKNMTLPSVPEAVSVWQMDMNINYQGNYASLLSFMDAIEQMNKTIYIKQLSISSDQTTGNLNGSLKLTAYALAKLDDETTFYDWNYTDKFGRIDPFVPYGGFSSGSVKQTSTSSQNMFKRDYFVSVNPVSSDLPTLVMGKGADTKGTSYLYADNPATEKVTFEFSGKEGKYEGRYSTGNSSWPGNGFESIAVQGGSIDILIVSSLRNSDSDKSGISLAVINNTDIPVRIKTQYDDSARPRIHIARRSGNVVAVE